MNIQNLQTPAVDMSFTAFGWTITTPPPPITGMNDYGQNPSPAFTLSKAEFQPIPSVQSTPANPNGGQFFFQSGPTSVDNTWPLEPNAQAAFALNTEFCPAITIEANIKGVNNSGTPATVDVSVTYTDQKTQQPVTNVVGTMTCSDSFTVQSLSVPATFLAPSDFLNSDAPNTSVVTLTADGSSFVDIAGVTITTDTTNITAKAQWVTVDSGNVDKNDKRTYAVAVTDGVTSQDALSVSVAQTLNIAGKVDFTSMPIGDVLNSVSVGLSAAYTTEHKSGQTHSVSLSKSTTVTRSMEVDAGSQEICFQIWQPQVSFFVGDQLLTTCLPDPVIINQYPPETFQMYTIKGATT